MIYRAGSIFIVIFWIVMTALLVRLEIAPESSELLDVPISHVVGLIFTHEQSSSLNIYDGTSLIGTLTLRPESPAPNERSLTFSGYVSTRLPMTDRQRIGLSGVARMDAALAITDMKCNVTLLKPPTELQTSIEPHAGVAKYRLISEGVTGPEYQIGLSENGARDALKSAGFEGLVPGGLPANMPRPIATARRAQFKLRNDNIDAYLLRVQQGETVMAEIYVSQLGQILWAKTVLGYTLSSDDLLQ
ncbi:MAG: hypothetical protein M3O82_09645 [Verrucomicrobiota bacterium]|nr:hypothetical protein [Verrucomicrobiota bacterium]